MFYTIQYPQELPTQNLETLLVKHERLIYQHERHDTLLQIKDIFHRANVYLRVHQENIQIQAIYATHDKVPVQHELLLQLIDFPALPILSCIY